MPDVKGSATNATEETVLVEQRGNTLLSTVNRPDARNTVDGGVSAAVGDELELSQNDPEAHGLISACEPISATDGLRWGLISEATAR